MLKRSTKESVQDVLASKEIYVSVSKTPAVTKLIWHLDPPSLGDNEDLKRKAPEARYLQILSACLTAMVLWGIFWQVHNNLIPQLFPGFSASAHHDSNSLSKIKSTANAFQGDLAADLMSGVGGRGVAAKHLLEASAEQIAGQQQQTDETSWGASLWPVLHHKLLREPDQATSYQMNLFRRLRLRK